jgi:hypothetical protein
MIAKEARLPNTAIENHHPELFEAIASFVIRNYS